MTFLKPRTYAESGLKPGTEEGAHKIPTPPSCAVPTGGGPRLNFIVLGVRMRYWGPTQSYSFMRHSMTSLVLLDFPFLS